MSAQVMDALNQANEVRLASAAIRREVGAMERAAAFRRAADLLIDPPHPIQRTSLETFIRSIPRMGPHSTRKLLRDLSIPLGRVVGPDYRTNKGRVAITTRQRMVLAAELRRRAEA